MEYQISDLRDLAEAFRKMAHNERQNRIGSTQREEMERRARAQAYETCATMVEQTRIVPA